MRKAKSIHRFYKSKAWRLARLQKITDANGLCERCGIPGEEVHHIIRLNSENIKDVNISLNPKNLEFLCKVCHNKEHNRFSKTIEFDSNGDMIRN
jgi:5-methylcytosine-specific restriction endonuclease McrA